ncbi:MAG TPA: helix-turn-helix transcriptional regulator [Thermodesulfobacteriota bacterium]|nr:helix-turn-helix transcriptional regulator [Thermodesulfobacteriota bacterium]
MNAYEKIGRKLQKAREEAGMSQEELAKRLGCSQASLCYYELGKRRIYFALLERISKTLKKPFSYFLENGEDSKSFENELFDLLKEPYLKDILFLARNLKPDQRKSVLEYIQWQQSSKGGGK